MEDSKGECGTEVASFKITQENDGIKWLHSL